MIHGTLALPVPPDRPVQQISVRDISSFVALVLENPDHFLGKRIDIASDELTGRRVAEIVSTASGRPIDYVQVPIAEAYEMSPDAAKMYEWFDAVGYSADIEELRRTYPETGWHTFEEWVRAQDWSILNGNGQKWLRKSEQGDKWNRCLIEGMIVLSETGARDEQTTPP